MKSAHSNFRDKPPLGPILVIDRLGLIGEPLTLKLSKEFLMVFVSHKSPHLDNENKNIIHIPFFKNFPTIPDYQYSLIVLIDGEGEDLEFLPKLIKKVKDVNAEFIFAQELSGTRDYSIGEVLRLYSGSKVVLFGDIFDDKLIVRKGNFKSLINKFIYQAQKFGKMQLIGEGLRETYPVALGDVVDGLIELVFGMHKPTSLFYIFPKAAVTEMSLAHMIQKNNPEVTIDFVRHELKLTKILIPPGGKNLLGDRYPLAKKIRGVEIKKKVKIHDENNRGDAKRNRTIPFLIIWVLFFLLLFPLIFTAAFSFFGSSTLYYAKGEIDKGNFVNAKSSLHLSQTFFSVGIQTLSALSVQAKFLGKENNLVSLSQDLNFGHKISRALLQIFDSEIYFSKILNGRSKNPVSDLAKGENYLKSSIIALNKVKAEGKIPAPFLQKLEIINPLIKFLSSTVDIMPNLLGMDGAKTYLILFQNNMELRPGGGLIDSYGILKINMGKIVEFSIHDVGDADKQLRGHVEPPFALRKYLPSEHWYLKDSNFDVDFARASLSSSNFLLAETGQKAAGVIALDISFVKNLLHAMGPVYIANYKEVVTEDNVYALTQSYAEKDFLRTLYKEIVIKFSKENPPPLLIAQAISESLSQKHLMVALSNDSQKIFTVNGWSSSLWDERSSSENSINDFIGINEANLGMNKANYFIKRQILQKITVGDKGDILEELTINYKNEKVALSGGDYKNYLRVILPQNIILSEISVNDVAQNIEDAITDPQKYEAKNFKAPLGLEVEKTIEENKTIYGFLVNILSGEIVKVKLKYSLAGNISGLDNFSYNLKFFKQPGVDNILYSLSFVYPKSFSAIKKSDGIIGEDGKASYLEKIEEDKNLIINFAKK